MITCRFENGNEASLRHVVVDAICIKDGKILLEKRSEKLNHGGKYALPGGFLNRDETLEEAVLRELREETGWKGEVERLLTVMDDPDRGDDRQCVAFLYLVKPLEITSKPDGEASEIKWFDIDDLPAPEEFSFDHLKLIEYYLKNKDAV